jgi:hypothetical protein
MTMDTTGDGLLNAHVVRIALAIYTAVVIVYGAWRSRASGGQDPVRESGPIL